MNVLILSAGTRNKVVQYFKRAVGDNGKVIATDMQNVAPAIYDADGYYIVPRITEPGYVDIILDICRKESINGVLSLIDPELSMLAENEKKFNEIGVTVIGSPLEQCNMSLDKWSMYLWLKKHGYSCAKTYIDFAKFEADVKAGKTEFPVFVKPRFGSASMAISKAEDMETAKFLFSKQDNMIVQQFLNGEEIGADVYIDLISGEVVSVFTKKKLLMRAGETDKAVSFKSENLFALIEKFVNECGYRGQIDIDLFESDGEYFISEVNPRFGGGYPHAYECGIDHTKLIVNNLEGKANEKSTGKYDDGRVMMKYNEIKVIKNA